MDQRTVQKMIRFFWFVYRVRLGVRKPVYRCLSCVSARFRGMRLSQLAYTCNAEMVMYPERITRFLCVGWMGSVGARVCGGGQEPLRFVSLTI